MKPFNLERALAGDPVVTRNGKPVEQLIRFKTEVKCGQYTLYGVVDGYIHNWTLDGRRESDTKESPFDLFMTPVKREGWIGISPGEYSDGSRDTSSIYKTREEVGGHFYPSPTFQIIKVEWEE